MALTSNLLNLFCFFFSCSCQRNIRIPLKFTFYLLGFFFIAYISSLQTIKAFTKNFYTKFFTVYFRAFIRCYVQILNSTHGFFEEKNRFYLKIYNIFKINGVENEKKTRFVRKSEIRRAATIVICGIILKVQTLFYRKFRYFLDFYWFFDVLIKLSFIFKAFSCNFSEKTREKWENM